MKKLIKTTYSLPLNLEKMLAIAAHRCNISREKLLKRALLQFLRSLHKSQFTHGNTIKYNSPSVKGFKRITVRLSAEEYSVLQQGRFYMRLSVSLMVATAIEEKLAGIVKAILKMKKKKREIKAVFFHEPLTRLRNFLIYWPLIKTNEVPFLAQRWNACLL